MKNLNELNEFRINNPLMELLGMDIEMTEKEKSEAGCFKFVLKGEEYFVIASCGLGWEHVSVSHKDHTPSWEIMCAIKDMFWNEEDVVMQLHPKKSEYVNLCKTCLHLWKPIDGNIPTPPKELVGV